MYSDSTNIRQNKVLWGQQEVKLATTVASDKLCTTEKIQVFWDVILHCWIIHSWLIFSTKALQSYEMLGTTCQITKQHITPEGLNLMQQCCENFKFGTWVVQSNMTSQKCTCFITVQAHMFDYFPVIKN